MLGALATDPLLILVAQTLLNYQTIDTDPQIWNDEWIVLPMEENQL